MRPTWHNRLHQLLSGNQQYWVLCRPGNESPKIPALYKVGPSKSFTASTAAISHLHLAAESSDSTVGAQITPEEVEYTSITQFQNKVELYRGRCVDCSLAQPRLPVYTLHMFPEQCQCLRGRLKFNDVALRECQAGCISRQHRIQCSRQTRLDNKTCPSHT